MVQTTVSDLASRKMSSLRWPKSQSWPVKSPAFHGSLELCGPVGIQAVDVDPAMLNDDQLAGTARAEDDFTFGEMPAMDQVFDSFLILPWELFEEGDQLHAQVGSPCLTWVVGMVMIGFRVHRAPLPVFFCLCFFACRPSCLPPSDFSLPAYRLPPVSLVSPVNQSNPHHLPHRPLPGKGLPAPHAPGISALGRSALSARSQAPPSA